MKQQEQVERFTGKIAWINGDIFQDTPGGENFYANIIRGIKGKDFFNIEYGPNKDDDGGLIKLTTSDGYLYEGGLYYENDRESSAVIQVKFYQNNANRLLVGLWKQNTWVFTVIIELLAVKDFNS